MKNGLRTALIVNLVALPGFLGLPLQANTKKFLAEVSDLELTEERELIQQALTIMREYFTYEKELINNCNMPDSIKQKFATKMQEKITEFNKLCTAQQKNTCFINKMHQTMKILELHVENAKIKAIGALLEELGKK